MTILKAIVAGVVTAAGTLSTAATDGHITLAEILAAVASTAVAFGGVYGVTNKTTPPAPPV